VSAALDDLSGAVAPVRGRPLNVWMGARKGPGGTALVTLVWEAPSDPGATSVDTVDHVTLTATAGNGATVFEGRMTPAEPGQRSGVTTFEAPPGPVTARAVAANARGTRVGAQDAQFIVPDFTSPHLQIGTPVLYRGRTARDLQQVRAGGSAALPAISRVFSRAERMLLRVSAYGPANTTPTVTLRLLNRSGVGLATLPTTASASDGGLEMEMGLGAFPPGDYVIEITAVAGSDTTKELVGIRITS
jgi:hypothetical protein